MSVADALAVVATARSLRANREPPAHIASIVLIGSTCTGKTTLASAVRAAGIAGIDVPRRFVTRAPRGDDIADEASHMTSAELDAAIAAGTVGLHWSRAFETGHVERYGFAAPRRGLVPFYSANNAICRTAEPPDALANALIVGVFAPDELRQQRLLVRSPDLVRERTREARARLVETSDTIVPLSHIIVDNFGEHEATAPAELVALVRSLV